MRRVIVESPFAAPSVEGLQDNVQYGRDALRDAISRGEAPFASHLIYPLVLDDTDPIERHLGLSLGREWMAQAELVAVYVDRGISPGMEQGIASAKALRLPIEYRRLEPSA